MIGGASVLDLADPRWWGLLLVAVVVVVPLARPLARAVALAAFYLGGIALLLGPETAFLAGVLAVLTTVTARGLTRLDAPHRPWLLAAAVAVTLGLFVLPKLGPPSAARGTFAGHLALLGFSYVALRMLDLWRAVADGRHAAPGLLATVCYLFPIHMLAAGPIQAYGDFAQQPRTPPAPIAGEVLAGLERIALGLFKAYVVAGILEDVFLTGFQAEGAYRLVELQLHYLWVYLDFSAYSDVAVGVGRLLGVATPENFDRPLAARNVTQLWERWHISLAQFLRRNVFLPLQLLGMRRFPRHSLWIATIAFLLTFALCGLWHELSAIFLLWGVYQGVGLAFVNLYRHLLTRRLGRVGMRRYLESKPIRWLATALTFEFVAVSLAFVLHPHLLEGTVFR